MENNYVAFSNESKTISDEIKGSHLVRTNELFIDAEIVFNIDVFFLITISLLSTDMGRNIVDNNMYYLCEEDISGEVVEEKTLIKYDVPEKSIEDFCKAVRTIVNHDFYLGPKRMYEEFFASDFGVRYLEGKGITEGLFLDVYYHVISLIEQFLFEM